MPELKALAAFVTYIPAFLLEPHAKTHESHDSTGKQQWRPRMLDYTLLIYRKIFPLLKLPPGLWSKIGKLVVDAGRARGQFAIDFSTRYHMGPQHRNGDVRSLARQHRSDVCSR